MKNEEWELHFLLGKREEVKIALTQWTRWWRGDIEEMDGRCEWSWLYFFDLENCGAIIYYCRAMRDKYYGVQTFS